MDLVYLCLFLSCVLVSLLVSEKNPLKLCILRWENCFLSTSWPYPVILFCQIRNKHHGLVKTTKCLVVVREAPLDSLGEDYYLFCFHSSLNLSP